jgi:predicted nucleic acid-binding protein
MSVIVDTTVWSFALRRNHPSPNPPVTRQLQTLIRESRITMIGAIRQEILSGVRTPEQFDRIQEELRAFPDLELAIEDYELAAKFSNLCRRNGVQGSNTDFLICAVAHRRGYEIFTLDKDFQNFQAYLSIKLFSA